MPMDRQQLPEPCPVLYQTYALTESPGERITSAKPSGTHLYYMCSPTYRRTKTGSDVIGVLPSQVSTTRPSGFVLPKDERKYLVT